MIILNRKSIRSTALLHRRLLAAILCVIMIATVIPPGTIMNVFAENNPKVTFVFTNKRGEGVTGINITFTGTDGEQVGSPDINGNEVAFGDLNLGSTYDYSIDVGLSGYLAPDPGSITINSNTNELLPITLYVPAPAGTISPQNPSTTFGDSVSFSVDATGMGNLSYVWSKDVATIDEATTETYTINTVLMSSEADYFCEVVSDLSADGIKLSLKSTLTVTEATPYLEQVSAQPGSGAPYNPAGITLSTTISHPTNNAVDKPQGNVEFFVDGDSKGEATLDNGLATLPNIVLTSGTTHSIYAKYLGTSDPNYTEATSSTISYEVEKITPQDGVNYTLSTPNGDNGWYKSGGTFVISLKNDGVFDKIRKGEDGTLGTEIRLSDETPLDGTNVIFYLVNSVTGEVSNPKTVNYKLDKNNPNNINKTSPDLNNYDRNSDSTYTIEFSASDDISGIAKIIWYDKNGDPNDLYPEQNGRFFDHLTKKQWQGISNIVAIDEAGNQSDDITIVNKSIEIAYSDETRIVNTDGDFISGEQLDSNSRYFYKADKSPVSITLTVVNKNFSENDITVTVNNQTVSVSEWVYNNTEDVYIGSIPALSEEGEYIIKITANGYTIFSEEYTGSASNNEYTSNSHVIDSTPPEIGVTYTPASLPDGKFAYDNVRTAVFTIKDKNFRPNELEFSSFSATDVQGNPLPNEDDIELSLLNAIKAAFSGVTAVNDVYTSSTVEFSTDANYSFTLKYTDLANNDGSYIETMPFIIDKSAPQNLQIVYKTNPVTTFLRIITFGFYNPSVTIQLYADDATSGVDHFNWKFKQEDDTSTTLNVSELEEQIDFTDSEHFSYTDLGKTAVATFTLTANDFAQYRGSFSFTATDKSGHTSDVHYGDGKVMDEDGNVYYTQQGHVVVVDTIAPTRIVTYPVPKQIRDKDTLVAYTGDKAVQVNKENINSIIYYDNTYGEFITVSLKITEANFYADDPDLIIKVNDEPYSINDWTQNGDEWTGTIKLVDDGSYVISATYVDHSGNVMPVYQSEKIVIDRVSPVVDKYTFVPKTTNAIEETTQFSKNLEYGFYFKTAFDVTIHTSDVLPSSGLEKMSYRLVPYSNGIKLEEQKGTIAIVEGIATLAIPAGFKGQIFAECLDNTGNKSTEVTPMAFVSDAAAPEINVTTNNNTSYKDAVGNRLFADKEEIVTVTATITDTVSGIREIGYAQSSEMASFERKTIQVGNAGYQVGHDLGDGWIISAIDNNLITRVTKTFSYKNDDNDIILSFDATDRSGNKKGNVQSEMFTVDKTDPVINIVFREDDDTDVYYSANRIADITVHERNFDATLIKDAIKNTFGSVPSYSFTEVSNEEYTAVVDFDEGDYTFSMSGTDLGNHAAIVNFSGGNEREFFVDKTKPSITDNFPEFAYTVTEDSFNKDKQVTITVAEHNFDPELIKLRVLRKDAGTDHNPNGLVDVTGEYLSRANWATSGDVHTITFSMSYDAVYKIEMTPEDLAGNTSDYRTTVVFEIDKTVPVVSAKNGSYVSATDTEFLEVYPYSRRDGSAPTVDFSDLNIDHIKYSLTVWVPDYLNSEAMPVVKPLTVYLKEDTAKSGIIKGSKFTIPNFTNDGVYALKLIAVDVAGNESVLNTNTYARMVDQDVLAYILDSNVNNKTGLYSFQYEDGTPISMRPDNFDDLKIFVLAKQDTNVDIVLRDTNADKIYANAQVTTDDSIYGFTVYNFLLTSDFFKDNYNGDTDIDLHLTVKNDEDRIDLGRMHIDNVAPTCVLPEEFSSWHWYFGEDSRTITLTNISELLDDSTCTVYDNGKAITPVYSKEDGTLTFKLDKGWHNVGVVLNDMAGNAYNVKERVNMHVGYFWLWILISCGLFFIGVGTGALIVRNKKVQKYEDD